MVPFGLYCVRVRLVLCKRVTDAPKGIRNVGRDCDSYIQCIVVLLILSYLIGDNRCQQPPISSCTG